MHLKSIAVSLLALGITGAVAAQEKQEKETTSPDKKVKEENIIIRKKGDSHEKMTIVVDGDKVTVNGKDLKDFKDEDFEVLRSKGDRLAMLGPRIREHINMRHEGMPLLGKDFNFSFGTNSAVLGVISEKNEKGAKIVEVAKESAAAKAGLQKDDILTKVGDVKVDDSHSLYEAIGKYKPQDKVTLTYLRDGKEATTTAILDKNKDTEMKTFHFKGDPNSDFNFKMPRMPEFNGMELGMNRKPRLGLQVQDLENNAGVKVLDVDDDTPAAKAGLQKSDVITAIDGKAVKSVDDLKAKVREAKEGDNLKISFQRSGKTQTVDVKFPKKLKTAEL